MPFISKEKIKRRLTLADIASRYSPDIREKGKVVYTICPFHADKKLGSCYFYTDSTKFTCKSCQTEGDMLNLASGYTGIPLTEMNDLLEQLVQDFGLNREEYLNDSTEPKTEVSQKRSISNEEYCRLTGRHYIDTDTTDGTERTFLRNIARRDPERHDHLVCVFSREIWMRKVKVLLACQYDEIERGALTTTLRGAAKTYNLEALTKKPMFPTPHIADVLSKPNFDACAFIEASMRDDYALLERCLRNPVSLKLETELRDTLYQREDSIQKVVSALLAENS